MKKWMKMIVAGMLAAAMACASACAAPGSQLGLDALEALYVEGENCILSPVSLAYALGMAAQGAEGETARQMLAIMDVDAAAEIADGSAALVDAGLKLANAAFLTGDVVPKEGYTDALREAFGAQWFENEGDMVQKINAWVADYTDGLIDQLIDGPISEDTALVLVNAVAMQAKWRKTFDADNTYEETFHGANGDVDVEFMHQTAYFAYGERDGVQLLRMDYVDDDRELTGLHMLIALPEAGGVADVLQDLQAEGLNYFEFGEESTEVRLSMPKVDISVESKLSDVLQALGMEIAFSDAADFSSISEDVPMKIGEVLQKARVQIDEEGTRAAAATAVLMLATASMAEKPQPVEMKLDRPFVFLIVDENSGSICFAGAIENPAE